MAKKPQPPPEVKDPPFEHTPPTEEIRPNPAGTERSARRPLEMDSAELIRLAAAESIRETTGDGHTVREAIPTRISSFSMVADRHLNASACLILLAAWGEPLGKRVILGDDEATFGRANDNTVVINSDAVSRKHARIVPRGHEFVLIDTSTNGSYVNDRRVTEQALRDGDIIKIGHSVYKFLSSGNLEAQYHEEIHKLATTDGLTGIANKRALDEFLGAEIKRFQRFQRPLSLIMFDIDHFKKVNDTHGHLAGDAVLKSLAMVVLPLVRGNVECFARFGGEEFALALPEVTRAGGMVYADKIRQSVAGTRFSFEGQHIPITVSLGVAEMNSGYSSAAQLVKAADTMLYRAKTEGRNRVIG